MHFLTASLFHKKVNISVSPLAENAFNNLCKKFLHLAMVRVLLTQDICTLSPPPQNTAMTSAVQVL